LIVDGAHYAAKAIEPIHHVDEAREVTLELDRTVPWLEGEGGAPHEPKVCLEERGIELFSDTGSAEHFLGFQDQALDRQDMLFELLPVWWTPRYGFSPDRRSPCNAGYSAASSSSRR
jgi:hypothetical protein